MMMTIDVRTFISLEINTYPRRIRRSSNLGHIFREKVRPMVRDIRYLSSVYKTQVEFRSHFSGKKCVLWSEKYGKYNYDYGNCKILKMA